MATTTPTKYMARSREDYLQNLTPATACTSSDAMDDDCACCMAPMSFLPPMHGLEDEGREEAAEDSGQAIILHGSHILCRYCTKKWLTSSNTCPTCRMPLFPEPSANGIAEAADAIAAAAHAIEEADQHVDSIMLQEQSEVLHLNVRHLEGDPFAQDYIVLPHFTPFLMNLLRRREAAYASGSMLMDYEYAQYSAALPPPRSEVGPVPLHARVVTESVVVDVWAWWANRYHSMLAYGWIDRRHHPVAIQLFLALLAILRCSVNGRLQPQVVVIKACLMYDIATAGDFEDVINDLAAAVVLATAGELSPRTYTIQQAQTIYNALFA